MSTWHDSRKITTRLVITGDLVLTTPAHLGNGEQGEMVDMLLQRDPLEGHPLLPGTSIAGALRAYLYEFEGSSQRNALAVKLFGGSKGDSEGAQSPLIVDDACAAQSEVEIRDGVGIDPKRRTARDKVKYDLELLPAGTIFRLRFELLLSEGSTKMEQALALALHGLEQSEIAIGARRSRGFGRCKVEKWQMVRYDLHQPDDLLAWLRADLDPPSNVQTGRIADLLAVSPSIPDARERVRLTARFELDSPLLIRAEQPLRVADDTVLTSDTQPDVIHLVNAAGQPVLPGTSLAGALRARAGRILRSFYTEAETKTKLAQLFGWMPQTKKSKPQASRLQVAEARINSARTLVQSRVGIDRFIGGAFDGALFHEAPCVAGSVETNIVITKPTEEDVGLLLLLLKDLWSGDLPLGGAASVGRGRLRGVHATLHWKQDVWQFDATEQGLTITGDPTRLESCVAKLARRSTDHAA